MTTNFDSNNAMAAPEPILHVVFNRSAGVDLGRALVSLGRDDRVIAFYDDLSFGPINAPDPATRTQWVETELGYDWTEIVADDAAFWDAALSHRGRRVTWLSRHSNQEYCGFLEFVWRLGQAPCAFADVTGPGRFGLMTARQIVEKDLLARARPITAKERDAWRRTWQALRSENAPLRVLRPDGALVSAPITHFDAALLAKASRDRWLPAARLIGEVMTDFGDVRQAGDLVLFARVRRLLKEGRLRAKDPGAEPDFDDFPIQGEVRLAETKPPISPEPA